MHRGRIVRLTILVIGALLVLAHSSRADIYRYIDENGVIHFTNIKTDSRYQFYMKSYRKAVKYIKDYEGIISQASKEFGIDPSFIKAVIKAESGFDNHAVSHKGAQGLMQLMPPTATEMDVGDPFNPEENIFGGTRYLSQLLERFNQDKVLALAAYNAGPEAVTSYQGVPPYPETQAFIKRVMAYYRDYGGEVE